MAEDGSRRRVRAGEGDAGPILTSAEVEAFREEVRDVYREYGRDLPWRRTRDPYAVLVSEVMLQQTQVPRVERKWPDFMSAFPDLRALAAAPLSEVLKVWRGMGYDRRAVHLKRMAETVVAEHGGELPRTLEGLLALPGVGPATAGAVAAFAYGEPHPYVETNIRAVYLHRFFGDRCDVPDRELMPLVEATLDRDDPREWYYALMDYGAHLKRTTPNPCRRSAHHAPQAPFAGSRRQARARLLRAVLDEPGGTTERYAALAGVRAGDAEELLGRLRDEGFLAAEDGRWAVA